VPCNQTASTTSGSQPPSRSAKAATEVVQVGAQVGKLSLPPAEDTAVLPPPGHPIGIDGRYGPATKTAKETSARDAVRIGIASLARELTAQPR